MQWVLAMSIFQEDQLRGAVLGVVAANFLFLGALLPFLVPEVYGMASRSALEGQQEMKDELHRLDVKVERFLLRTDSMKSSLLRMEKGQQAMLNLLTSIDAKVSSERGR